MGIGVEGSDKNKTTEIGFKPPVWEIVELNTAIHYSGLTEVQSPLNI